MHTDKIPQYFGKDLESMSFAKNYHRWILAEFSPYLGQNIAEVGAGTGNFSILLLETNIRKLKAFEPSDNMFPLLKKTLSKDKRACVENNFFGRTITEEEHFDSVLYVNVLEHIEDDMSELIKAHDALVSGGRLLIFAPALPALYSNMDRQIGHFRRYTKKNLLKLVQNSGFSIIKAKYFDVAGIIPWYINFVLLKNQMSSRSISLYDKAVVPIMRIVENTVAPPIGKNLLVIAKKV